MTSPPKNQDPSFKISPVCDARDLLAYAVHQLGYWPSQAVVVLAAGRKNMGPVLRINAVDLKLGQGKAAGILAHYLSLLPAAYARDSLSRFFVLVFASDRGIRAQHLNLHQQLFLAEEELREEEEQLAAASGWLKAAELAAADSALELAGLFFVGQSQWWQLKTSQLHRVANGLICDIANSPLYLDLMMQGSLVSSSQGEALQRASFKARATLKPDLCRAWLQQAGSSFEKTAVQVTDQKYGQNFVGQKYAEARFWNLAIEKVLTVLAQPLNQEENKNIDAVYADRIRHVLPAQIAGFLAGTLSSVSSLQFVLYQAGRSLVDLAALLNHLATYRYSSDLYQQEPGVESLLLPPSLIASSTDFVQLQQELAQAPAPLLGPALENSQSLQHFSNILLGQVKQDPCWQRLDALDRLCSVLLLVSEEQQAAYLAATQAWIAWFKGSSSRSRYLLEPYKEGLGQDLLILERLLDTARLPRWLTS